MKAPTNEQCEARACYDTPNDRKGYAFWHPQWGGYSGKAILVPMNGCFNVYIWHDGEFPIDDEDEPYCYHYCSVDQLVEFGDFAKMVVQGT
jgi:hypothetical protein